MGRGGAEVGRELWLAYERVPHPDAVCYGATAEDVELVLDLFAKPYAERVRLVEALRNYLKEQAGRGLLERRWVPVRRASGLYHAMPWRLAKWLACVLGAEEGVIEGTGVRLRRWLEGREERSLQVVS